MVRSASSRSLDKVARLIPGYDPFETAGDCRFDRVAAQTAIDFFHECLKHVKGAKSLDPLILEPWQQAIIGNLFGWKRKDGTRRYREAFIYVPRKNGKTCLAAGIVNYVLFCDGEPGAEIYSAAADRDQATLVFEQAKGMVLSEPELANAAKVYQKSIVVGASSYKAISADANTKHGYNTHCAVIDELHAQTNRDLVDVLVTSTGARTQPLIVHITTADYDRPSICNEKLDYAEKVRDGIIEDASFLPVIYAASLDDDWKAPAVWKRANPNLGVSVSEEYLERECKRAQESPAYENTFKRLHLNVRTEQDVRLIPMDQWDAIKTKLPELDGRECFGGLDLASTTDIAAFVLAFPNDDGSYDVLPFFFVPEESARQRSRRDRVPYEQWIRETKIEATDGNVIDYDVIRERINELSKRFNIKAIARDRWNATQITTQLQGDGFEVVDYGQGFRDMTAPTKELVKLVASGKLNHGQNPVLRWMASNCAGETDAAGNLKLSKKKSSEKIDGMVALVMALGLAIGNKQSPEPQVLVW